MAAGFRMFLVVAVVGLAGAAYADQPTLPPSQNCLLPESLVKHILSKAADPNVISGNGGILNPNQMWAAVVDRNGIVCGITKNSGDAWPGSRAIAIAKAETANDFSNNTHSISTANLYAPTQPGGSLYGLNNSNPYNPLFNAPANDLSTGVGFVDGGIITFGGGLALYRNGKIIGGLGVSGDTSCADHAFAWKMRRAAGLDSIPASNFGLNGTDNIIYAPAGQAPTGFEQPHCLGTSDVTPQ